MSTRILQTLVVGGGPAGLSLLLSARHGQLLSRLLSSGIKVVEKSGLLGPGEIGQYDIRTDSFADSFIRSPNSDGIPELEHLMKVNSGAKLAQLRGQPVSLKVVADYLSEIGSVFHEWDIANRLGLFLMHTEALSARLNAAGYWSTQCREENGRTNQILSKSIVITTGAQQSMRALSDMSVAGEPLLPRFSKKVLLSKEVLGLSGVDVLKSHLNEAMNPRVVIVGGSHSALSSANVCLSDPSKINCGKGSVTILHQRSLALTYPSPQAAHDDGYHEFGAADICPVTGRVFPLAGFRSDSRELMRKILGLGGLEPERRVRLVKLTEESYTEANQILEAADIIIAALGYRPRVLPLFDEEGERIQLRSEVGHDEPLVDEKSRVLTSSMQPVTNAYGMGLSAGYPLAGRYGETSFDRQANGLALWQSDIGTEIVNQVMGIA